MDFSEDVGCQVVEVLKEEVGNHVVTFLSVVVEVVVVLMVVVALVVIPEGENCGFFLFFFFFLSFSFCFFHHSNLFPEESFPLSRILDLNLVLAAPPS